MRNLLLFIFLFHFYSNLVGQTGRQFYFTHYGTASGLVSSEINTAIQDADGYIWAGSTDGLQRFDGTRFKTFTHITNDSSSLPSNQVIFLTLDHKKNMWVITGEGRVGIFDTRTFRYKEARVKARKAASYSAAIKRLIKDEYGNLFYLLGGGEVLTWNEKKNEFSFENNFFTYPPDKGIADFIQQPGTKKYWISFFGDKIAVYDRTTGLLSYEGKHVDKEPAIKNLENITGAYNLFFDRKNRLWFQVWGPGSPVIYKYELDNREPEPAKYSFIQDLRSYYETNPFFEQSDGTVWVHGLSVLARYLEKEKRFEMLHNGYHNDRSIVYEKVNSMFEDRENNIWVSTRDNGLYRFNPSRQYFTNIKHINRMSGMEGRGSVMSIVPTKWNTYLVGAWGDGLFHYDRDFNLLPTNIKGIDNKLGPSPWCMIRASDSNTIWIGAQPGLWAIDQSARNSRFYNPPVLLNKTIRQVVEDKQGNLWLGMQNFGLFRWDAGDKKAGKEDQVKRFDSLPITQVNKLIVDRKGLVWAGTANNGLYVIDPVSNKVVMHFSMDASGAFKLKENGISSMLEYDDSTVIITTTRQLILFNRYLQRSILIGTPEMMPGFIAAVERDDKGYLWVSTTNGLYRVNIHSRVFVRFNREDGIDNDRFVLAASVKLPDGRLVFGSSNQFSAFHPREIGLQSDFPGARITDFKLMNRSLKVDSLTQLKEVTLKHNSNSVVIEFATLAYSDAYLIKYRLANLDDEWKVADNNAQAIYSYLPPGKYTFEVMTVDPEGRQENKITRLQIRVNGPFWKKWWFYSLLVIGLAFLLYRFDRERMKRKADVQKMRSNIAGNLHNEVNTALNNINILSEMARLKADKDPEKSKEYIEQIHTKSHNMIIAMDDMLWSLDPENDSMAKTTDRMREYLEALKNRHQVNIEIEVEKKVEALALNMQIRHEAFLVFKEGIKNLITVGAKNCRVYVSIEKGYLVFTTQFDSDSCDMQLLNNLLHRQDLERRLNRMNANIDVQLHKSRSVITLEVPIQ